MLNGAQNRTKWAAKPNILLKGASEMSAVINTACPRPAHPDHHVDFYAGDDGFIYDAVADFFAEGLRVGQPLIFLSTPQHRDRIFSLLTTLGEDVSAAVANGQLRYVDARETISTFM